MRHVELQVVDSAGKVVARVSVARRIHLCGFCCAALQNRAGKGCGSSIHANVGIVSGARVSFGDVEAQG